MTTRALVPLLAVLSLAGCDGGGGSRLRVTVERDGVPVPAAVVFRSDSDGGLIATTTTDSSGQARIGFAEGDWISAAFDDADGDRLLFTRVAHDGGDLTFGWGSSTPDVVATANVEYDGPVPGAAAYVANVGIGSAGVTTTSQALVVPVHTDCLNEDGTFDVLLRATNASMSLAYSVATGQSVAPSGTTTVTMPSWRTDFLDVAITVSGLPAGAYSTEALASMHTPCGHVTMDSQGIDGAGTMRVVSPAVYPGNAMYWSAGSFVPLTGPGDGFGYLFLGVEDDDVPLAREMSFADSLGAFEAVGDAPDEGGRPSIEWSVPESVEEADRAYLIANWNPNTSIRWGVSDIDVAARSIRFPELPDALEEWRLPGPIFTSSLNVGYTHTTEPDVFPVRSRISIGGR